MCHLFFSLGTSLGFIFMELAKLEAKRDMDEENSLAEVSLSSFQTYLQSISKLDPNLFGLPFYREYKELIFGNTLSYRELVNKYLVKVKDCSLSAEYLSFLDNNDYLLEFMQHNNFCYKDVKLKPNIERLAIENYGLLLK